jgi:hypothetical protein
LRDWPNLLALLCPDLNPAFLKKAEGTAAVNDGMKQQEEEEAEAGDKAPAGARTGSGM